MEQSWPSIWLLIRSWLTPAVLFLLLNSIIGIIALTSKTLHRRGDDPAAGDGHVIARTASSALHRLRTLSLTRLRSSDLFFDQKSDEIATASPKAEVVEKEDEGESTARMMIKSASERSARGSFEKKKMKEKAVAVEEEVDGGVDAQADDFINRFRRQLHLQRQISLLNYKEMLNRGK